MNNILFVSIAFPPKTDAEGLQVAKYLKYLLRNGSGQFYIDAVTSSLPTLNMAYDSSLETLSDGVRQRVEIPIIENRYTNFLLRKLAPWIVQSPDSKFSFHWQSTRAVKLLNTPPDLIYSRSFPVSSAAMAYKLKRYYNVPWIMHLSDLWADCPEMRYTGRSMSYNQKIEKKCFETADVICVTSKKTLEFYMKKYSSMNKRIEYFPNVFDFEDIETPEKHCTSRNEKLRIVYTGSMAGDRSPEQFLKAVSLLSIEEQKKLEVIFIGSTDRKNNAIFDRYSFDCISCHDQVDYQKALEYQRSADVLLLIDMPVKQSELRVFFPSKILDYVIAKKPILALVDDGSESQSVINKNYLGTCMLRHDVVGIRDHLMWLLSERDSAYFNEREVLADYDASFNAKRLISLFNEFI